MAIFYKPFIALRIVLCACFLLFSAQSALASNSLFTVEDVKVDITADSALTARDQAFSEARQQAFQSLAGRMLSESEMQNFTLPEPDVISPLIQDYELTQEKLSSVRYIGTYTFRFKEREVRRYFSGSGVAYTEVSSKPLLILPFYETGGQTKLWSPDNLWMRAWNRTDNLGTLVPLVVPIGDLQDVSDVDDSEALNYRPQSLRRMISRYQAGEAVLVIAVPDDNLRLVDKEGQASTGALTVNIYRTDRNNPEFVQQIIATARANQTLGGLMDEAVRGVQTTLQKDWKARTAVPAQQMGRIHVRAGFGSFREWTAVQNALERVAGVEEVVLRSLSPKEARLELVFRGDEQRLRLAMAQVDLSLSEPQRPPLYFNSLPGGEAEPSVYDLYLGSRAPGYSKRF